jgi:hypothetical protein
VSSNTLYISVLSPATASGNITLDLTFPAGSQTITVAVTDTDSELDIARSIVTEIQDCLDTNDLNYSGVPAFEDFPATFQINRTAHVVSVWSQITFEIVVDVAATGTEVISGQTPCFMTSGELADYAAISGLSLDTADGSAALSSSQLALLIEIASSQVVSLTNNPIILSTHVFESIGTTTNSVRLPFRPVVDFDAPQVKFPGPSPLITSAGSLTVSSYGVQSFRVNHRLGTLYYTMGSLLVDANEPFAWGNTVLVSYRAGSQTIPSAIKQACVMLASILPDNPNLKSLHAADWGVDFISTGNPMISRVKALLAPWVL